MELARELTAQQAQPHVSVMSTCRTLREPTTGTSALTILLPYMVRARGLAFDRVFGGIAAWADVERASRQA